MDLLELSEINLMAVDDQEDILSLSKAFIEEESDLINVETTKDPFKAYNRFKDDEFDAILSDYDMPEMNGIEFLRQVREEDDEFPFILYTGKGTEDIAKEAINAGVTGYYQKEAGTDQYSLIANRIESTVIKYREVEKNKILSTLIEYSEQPVIVTDPQPTILYANPAFEEFTGYKAEEIIGKDPKALSSSENNREILKSMYDALGEKEEFQVNDMTNKDSEGEEYTYNKKIIPITVKGEEPDYFLGLYSDIRKL